jgi:hypothetical protein
MMSKITISGSPDASGKVNVRYSTPGGANILKEYRCIDGQVYCITHFEKGFRERSLSIPINENMLIPTSSLLPQLRDSPPQYHAARNQVEQMFFEESPFQSQSEKDKIDMFANYEIYDVFEERAWFDYGRAQKVVKEAGLLKKEERKNLQEKRWSLVSLLNNKLSQSQPK